MTAKQQIPQIPRVESSQPVASPDKLHKKLSALKSEESDIAANLDGLQAELSSALVAGSDSTFLRRKVRDCQITLNDVCTRVADVRNEIERLLDEDIQAKSRDVVQACCVKIQEKLAEFDIEEISMTGVKVELDGSISLTVERARLGLKVAEDAHVAAKETMATIAARVQALEDERQVIIQARMQGAADEQQEARLAVVAADLEGLKSMLGDATAQVELLDPAKAREMLTHRQKLWEQHLALREYEAIAVRTTEIEATFLRAVSAQQSAGVRAGRGQHLSQSYRPSEGLRRLVGYGVIPGSL